MGYDMRWLRKSSGEEEAVAEARTAFYAACAVRDAIPKEERGEYTAEEWRARRDGKAGFDDLPANASERYRSAQEAVLRLSRALHKADASYFRLNIWGMGKVRDAMERLGALYGDYDRVAEPDYPQNLPDDYYEDDGPERFPERHAQVVAALSWSPRENGEGGIPLHKTCSNDGWIVTPEECFVAASIIRAADTQDVLKVLVSYGIDNEGWLETWNDWVQWLADASEHGGFEVH